MTTPDFPLPVTHYFTRNQGTAYGVMENMMCVTHKNLDFFYLPAGQNMIRVIATQMDGASLQVELFSAGGVSSVIQPLKQVTKSTELITVFETTVKAAGSAQGRWVKIKAQNVSTANITAGTVGAQVITTPLAT